MEFVDSKATLDFTAKMAELDDSSHHLRQTANVTYAHMNPFSPMRFLIIIS